MRSTIPLLLCAAFIGIFLSLISIEIVKAGEKNTTTIPYSINISKIVIIKVTDANISLEDIERGKKRDSQDMATQGNNNKNGYRGINKSGDWFNMTNEGTVKINIEGYATTSIFGTKTEGANIPPNRFFRFYANASSSGMANTTRGNIPGSFETRTKLVTALDNNKGKNNALIGIMVEVPADENAGRKESSIYFVATQAG